MAPVDDIAVPDRPLTGVEQTVAGIWSELLGVTGIGPDDRFSALGGHSLLTLQVLWRLQDRYGVDLTLQSVFQASTLADLAGVVEDALGRLAGQPTIMATPRDGAVPLSAAQEQLWFFNELVPDHPLYNVPHGLRLEGDLDSRSLQRALAEMVRRHDILRTRFVVSDGEPKQVVDPSVPTDLRIVDLRAGSDDDTAIGRVIRHEVRRPFDLTTGPPFRLLLIGLGETCHLLVVTMHHIVIDGWSVQVLLNELAALYRAFRAGTAPDLPEPELHYADYAVWQRSAAGARELDGQLRYWRHRLADLPEAPDLPFGKRRPEPGRYRGEIHHFEMDPTITTRLRALGDRESATLFMTLLAGLQCLLHRYTGMSVIGVGTPASGRVRREVESTVGPFVNTVVMRADLDDDPSFAQLLRRTRETAVTAYAHQEVPFQHVVRELRPIRDLRRNPLVQVLFWVLPRRLVASRSDWGELTVRPFRLEGAHLHEDGSGATGTVHMDLEVFVREQGDGLACSIRYRADLFERDAIERLSDDLVQVLRAVAQDPDRPVSSVLPIGIGSQRADAQPPAPDPLPSDRDSGPVRPQPTAPPGSTPYVAPGTTTERAIATIWADLLGVKQVGAQDGFFELGGYSILAVQVLGRIERELGVRLPVTTMFEAPTLAWLAEEVDRADRGGTRPR
jgi:acyl carrier protein